MRKCSHYCRSFREEASKVWHDMSDADLYNISRGEETTTEQLLLRLARKHSGRGLTIKTYTKAEERLNGADWGFWFEDKAREGIALRVQAKRLYPKSGKYEKLYHEYDDPSKGTGADTQCEALLKSARNEIPLYVFYNSDALDIPVTYLNKLLSEFYLFFNFLLDLPSPTPSPDWGISVASALAIKNADWGKKNRPGNFPMVPWHYLVCSCCWRGNHSADSSLPSRIGQALRDLYDNDRKTIEGEEKDPFLDTSFEPTKEPPIWVGLLRENSPEEELLLIMESQNLHSISIITEKNERYE